MKLTPEFVARLRDIISAGLVKGLGQPAPGQTCVESAISLICHEPHSDAPSCVHSVLQAFYIALDDAPWSSNQARATALVDGAVAQLGTAECFDSRYFVNKITMFSVTHTLPTALRAAADIQPEPHRSTLQQCAQRCESAGDLAAAAASAAASEAANAAYEAAYYADSAASAAARAASCAASYAASYAVGDAAGDKPLIDLANYAVQLLSEMRTPGSAFLQKKEAPCLQSTHV